ncbi:TPA: hypothetical protein DEB00_01230 [Candidatus Uhrbacteria bacterium]|nr:hypothetical protein [Candidatus Uhrbacteria bacterium]
MSNGTGSIEDLMGNNKKPIVSSHPDQLTTQEQLQKRMGSIRADQIEKVTEQKAAVLGVGYVDLKGFPVNAEALRLLPEERARELKAIPFLLQGEEIRIAAIDPTNEAVKEVAFQMGERNRAHTALYLTSQQSLEQGLKLYATLPKIIVTKGGVEITEEELKAFQDQIQSVADIQGILDKANTTDLVAAMLAGALEIGTSDVHIEAEEKDVAIRYRIDGVLQDIAKIRKDIWDQLINRIKLIAGLKLNVTAKPQDGRYTIFIKGEKVDVRTSTLPTAYGESVVMRLLVPSAIGLEFAQLGFREAAFKKLEAEIVKPNGMIVTTGPTGSGKTTTLYAILKRLNTPDVKIITLEDPVEYKLEGINQSQIDHTKDYTFSAGLRSILRQDPDIVMVGEIRDKETAETAIQAALTGHLLLSTIHTNDAAGAVPRFLSMGVEPALLAPALRIIMGQRLVRRLCKTCAVPATLTTEELERVTKIIQAIPEASGEKPDLTTAHFMTENPKGCSVCTGGFKGRVGVYEILVVDQVVEERIRSGSVSDADMRDIAFKQGMVTMEQDGLLKAMEGQTSIQEIFRVAAN